MNSMDLDIKDLVSQIPQIIPQFQDVSDTVGSVKEQVQRIKDVAGSIDTEQIKQDIAAAVDSYKKAEMAKLAMQAISTAGLVFLGYVAWQSYRLAKREYKKNGGR